MIVLTEYYHLFMKCSIPSSLSVDDEVDIVNYSLNPRQTSVRDYLLDDQVDIPQNLREISP